jgi:hypothetical protein
VVERTVVEPAHEVTKYEIECVEGDKKDDD